MEGGYLITASMFVRIPLHIFAFEHSGTTTQIIRRLPQLLSDRVEQQRLLKLSLMYQLEEVYVVE